MIFIAIIVGLAFIALAFMESWESADQKKRGLRPGEEEAGFFPFLGKMGCIFIMALIGGLVLYFVSL
jgi:hypothetical protein